MTSLRRGAISSRKMRSPRCEGVGTALWNLAPGRTKNLELLLPWNDEVECSGSGILYRQLEVPSLEL